ncbi:pentapeptide repeat-containing protein [Clostridium sp.]|uniref:pentapeptide repeat-containing protein n=1 Tax=Clostridium sp. TaxID=1506 RepID=UPI002FDEABBC
MMCTHKYDKELKADCKKCFGLCCVALYFSVLEGFPKDKDAGKPCVNLRPDFTCAVHKELAIRGLKGCTAYECLGAGQKVSQITFKGYNWLNNPECASEMFEIFLIMRQLHEMLWYLTEAFVLQRDRHAKEEINSLIDNTEQITLLDSKTLLTFDIAAHRSEVNIWLKNTSNLVRGKCSRKKNVNLKNGKAHSLKSDYFGYDLRKTNLRGADLRGACLIAANISGVDLSWADLIGADLRDADLSGTNLKNSIFLTQAQLNTAKGDLHTKLPMRIVRPVHWLK